MEGNRGGQERMGAGCFYHPIKNAQTQCVQCGRPICQECAQAGRILAGSRVGRSLCFGCGEKLAEENMVNLQKIRSQSMLYLVRLAVGILAGLAVGVFVSKIFPWLSHGMVSVIFKLFFAGLGVIFLCVPSETAKQLADFSLKVYGTSNDQRFWVRLLKGIVCLAAAFFMGIATAVRKGADMITQIGKVPGAIRRNLEAQSQIMNYRKSFGNALESRGTSGSPERELSQVITQIVADHERFKTQ